MSLLFLLKIPLISQIIEYIWTDDDDEKLAPEYCLTNVLDTDCIVRLAVKALGIAMIGGAFLNKAPIILNIIAKQSVAGLAKSSMYGEIIVLTNAFLYGFREGLPFTSYGENFALLLQTTAIVGFIWSYSKVSLQEMIGTSALWAAYVYGALVILPLDQTSLLMQTLLPIVIYAKGSQIMTIFAEKHTGNQSIITLSMNVIGTSIRVLTTIGEVGWDWNLLSGHIISALLNFTLFSQYFYFQENTRVYWEKQTVKKKE
jgi:mannose-P-dolichol utilization defect protein 1